MPRVAGARWWKKRSGAALATVALAGVVSAGARLHAQAKPRPNPAPVPPRVAEATRALSAGDLDRAVQLGTAYLKQHPDDQAARIVLAQVHISRNELDAAYLEIRHVLAVNPRNVDALYYQGLVSARLAGAEFQRLETMAPGSARVHQLQAESLEAQGKRAAAETEYEVALKGDPDLLEALLGLARLKRIRLACDEAVRLYDKAETARPTFDGAYGLGICQSLLQDDESARASFERAIARDPHSAVAWMGLGEALAKLHRPADAVVKLQHAIALEPRLGEAYYALGMAYQATGQKALAQQAFKTAERFGGAVGVAPDSLGPTPAPR
jgi:tetratricopeptide (TPR) repeat protein